MASPLPIEQKFAVAVLSKLGRPVTAGAVKNLLGWMRAEGGHTHNSAHFNFLNTTQPAPGAGNTGSQGNIKVYRSFDQGVNATAQTLNNGRYGAILHAFNADPGTFAAAVNSTPWGTKSDFSSISRGFTVSGNFADALTRSAQSGGAASGRAADPGVDSSATPGSPVSLSGPQGLALMRMLAATKKQVLAGKMPGPGYAKLIGRFASQMIQSQPIDPAAAQAGVETIKASPVGGAMAGSLKGAIAGSPVPGQSPHSSTHETSGLAGYPAFDYMAPAGTKVGAPVSGTIFKLSGKDPRAGFTPHGPMGYSIYLQGTNGKKYYMTHLDKVGVKVGQRVKQGQQIAVVANAPAAWSSPHVHMGVNG